MTKNHEPTLWTRIGWHFEEYGFAYATLIVPAMFIAGLIWLAVDETQRIAAKETAQQACVLQGKVPAEVYGKISCVAPEALR